MSGPDTGPSIRRRLLALLLIPTALIAAAATYGAYRTALGPMERAYDRELLDTAYAIASNLEARGTRDPALSLTADAASLLHSDSVDTIYFRVSGGDGHFIAGDAGLPVLHQRVRNPLFADANYRGEPIRIASYRVAGPVDGAIVTVGETLHKRDLARQNVLRTSLAVDAAQLATALVVIWWATTFAIAPLHEVQRQVEVRRPRDLEPLATHGVPAEIRGVIDALNRLFGTLREAEIAERSFLENAAHQLRTPLAGMLAQLEVLAADEKTDPARARAVLDSARRLARTARQLLAMARSDAAARAMPGMETVSLPGVVEACVGSRLAAADQARIDLGAQIDPASTGGIPWMLEEALGNLADNAIAATPAGGSVTLRCGTAGGLAFLEVSDTGTGIPEAERALVFGRFYRASNARYAGSGLGLAIVGEVARAHAADIALDTAAGGRGLRVRITFPQAFAATASPRTQAARSFARAPVR